MLAMSVIALINVWLVLYPPRALLILLELMVILMAEIMRRDVGPHGRGFEVRVICNVHVHVPVRASLGVSRWRRAAVDGGEFAVDVADETLGGWEAAAEDAGYHFGLAGGELADGMDG